MTIQILEQRIPAPTVQQCMDAIRKYSERMSLTKEIRDASTGVALYSRGGNPGDGHGRRAGARGGGRGKGRHKHYCTYCKTDNHTTKACGKRKNAERDTNNSRNDERTCYHCGLTGHFKGDCVHFKRARDERNKVNNGTASASLATAGDRDLT
jgi:hypothetical protein